ncbi:MAG: hypothetical protein K2W86_08635, partial [Sphingomonas sp.]|uniref:hypothetical protein n=1 Tax=Sphingomonas sp. TaxID=28214 RepID=UPI0035A8AD00|nr:hypothetical protein [Sphingomonas sp.]
IGNQDESENEPLGNPSRFNQLGKRSRASRGSSFSTRATPLLLLNNRFAITARQFNNIYTRK